MICASELPTSICTLTATTSRRRSSSGTRLSMSSSARGSGNPRRALFEHGAELAAHRIGEFPDHDLQPRSSEWPASSDDLIRSSANGSWSRKLQAALASNRMYISGRMPMPEPRPIGISGSLEKAPPPTIPAPNISNDHEQHVATGSTSRPATSSARAAAAGSARYTTQSSLPWSGRRLRDDRRGRSRRRDGSWPARRFRVVFDRSRSCAR